MSLRAACDGGQALHCGLPVDRSDHRMWVIFLEALAALLLLVGLVWWTMRGKK